MLPSALEGLNRTKPRLGPASAQSLRWKLRTGRGITTEVNTSEMRILA